MSGLQSAPFWLVLRPIYAPSNLNTQVANLGVFRGLYQEQGGSDGEEFYRAAHERGTEDLRAGHQGE